MHKRFFSLRILASGPRRAGRRHAAFSVLALVLAGSTGFAAGAVAAAGTTLVGDAQIEPSGDSNSAGMAEAFQFSASATGTVATLNVFVSAGSNGNAATAGLYADGAGHPGALLTQGTISSPAAGSWNAIPVGGVTVTSGVTYWIALLGPVGSGTLGFQDRCCGGNATTETSAQANLSTLPASWSAGTRYFDGPASVYAAASGSGPAPSQVGQWSSLMSWPLVAVHSVLLHTGNVAVWDGWQLPTSARVYNPGTQAFSNISVNASIFCSGHIQLSDGRILVAGGWAGSSSNQIGIPNTYIFDPVNSTWTRAADMKIARWYPSLTELPDGRALVFSGQIDATHWATTPEVYDPVANTWTLLSGISTPQVQEPEYPLSFLQPSGGVLAIAPSISQTYNLDTVAQTATAIAGTSPVRNGTATMYRPGKILYSGGGDTSSGSSPSQSTADILDTSSSTPAWQATGSMTAGRYDHTLTVLPDGNVLAVGGAPTASETTASGVLPAEIWNPSTGVWSAMASMAVPRIYHSTALLLPDGRVLVAGSGHEDLGTTAGEFSAQYYSPPYLFQGSRPTISAAPAQAGYGTAMTLSTPDASSISSVSLVSLGADTHTLDMDQHFVPLSFTAGSGSLTVQAPTSSAVAPPGYYMVFIVNSAGVPSTAAMVHLQGAAADTQAPSVTMTAPANGSTVSGSGVSVSATATDNVGVSSVQFTLDGSALGAPVTASPYQLVWDTTAVGNGSHTLAARALDAAGNVGTATAVSVSVNNAAPGALSIDRTVTRDGHGAVTTPALTTTKSGDLLVALVSSDGPQNSPQTATVNGGGLTWTMLRRTNTQAGTSEVWTARAPGILTNGTVTSTQSAGGFDQSLTVVALAGASATGATSGAAAATGAPSVALTATKTGSWTFAAGNDWDRAVGRTLGGGQTMTHQWVDTGSGDTFWAQSTTAPTGVAGSTVAINDTAPTNDRWNLAAVEVLGT